MNIFLSEPCIKYQVKCMDMRVCKRLREYPYFSLFFVILVQQEFAFMRYYIVHVLFVIMMSVHLFN